MNEYINDFRLSDMKMCRVKFEVINVGSNSGPDPFNSNKYDVAATMNQFSTENFPIDKKSTQ